MESSPFDFIVGTNAETIPEVGVLSALHWAIIYLTYLALASYAWGGHRSSSFLIASFGIPFRRRRSLGRIEMAITLGVWLAGALAVWIILRWF